MHGYMRHTLYILYILALVLPTGCTGKYNGSLAWKGEGRGTLSQSADTVHTRQVAMSIYAYQPARALQIIDSALIVGNVGEVQAQQCRARIYSFTQMYDQMDSLLGGSKDVRLDSAQAIAERLLDNDSIKADLKRLRDVLEILAYTDRMKCDTLGWIQWSSKLVDLCRQMGPEAEADALRTEAEIAAALCALGQEKEAMAKLDSVISSLSGAFRFSELDALIVALKRKIVFLGSRDRYAETLPLSRQIIERLDDYEAHPDKYHDGSHREPNTDQKRADYIRFYRSQAQSYQTAALAALGEHGNMLTAFRQIEDGVREATAREHIARYNALQQKIEAEHQLANAERANLIAAGIGILALLAIAFAVILFHKNRVIRRKNRILAQQITDAVDYKELYYNSLTPNRPTPSRPTPSRPTPQPLPVGRGVYTFEAEKPEVGGDYSPPYREGLGGGSPDEWSDEQLFEHIHGVIVREKLFLDPKFERQTIMDRFQLSKERVGAVFSKGSDHAKMSNYIQQLRLEYAAQQLVEQPERSIAQIATECGFSSHKYFSDRFRQYFSMTPTEFRKARL